MGFKIKTPAEIAAEKAQAMATVPAPTDTPAFPPNGEMQDAAQAPQKQEVQQDAFVEKAADGTPKTQATLDLAKIPPELREVAYAAAKQAGARIENEYLASEKVKRNEPPANALSLDFSSAIEKEANGLTEPFRLSKRRDLDVLFDGLNVGPQFQDAIVADFKEKLEKEGHRPNDLHFIIYIYLALAIPNDREADDGSRWSTGAISPKDFQRLVPKEVRNHFRIQIWYKRNGSRADAVWYRAFKVENSKEATEAMEKAKSLGKMAGAACEMILAVPKDSGYTKNILDSYKVE